MRPAPLGAGQISSDTPFCRINAAFHLATERRIYAAAKNSVVRNSPAMHSIVRFSDGVLVEVNETVTRTLGYSRDEVIGKTPFELNFWVARERLHAYREQLVAGTQRCIPPLRDGACCIEPIRRRG